MHIPIQCAKLNYFIILNITKGGFPTVAHRSHGDAYDELQRLKLLQPGHTFIIALIYNIDKPKRIYTPDLQFTIEELAMLPDRIKNKLPIHMLSDINNFIIRNSQHD